MALALSLLVCSRAHLPRQQHGAVVDDVVGELEPRVTDFFASDTIIPHGEMGDIISIVHELEQLFVTFGTCLLTGGPFRYGHGIPILTR